MGSADDLKRHADGSDHPSDGSDDLSDSLQTPADDSEHPADKLYPASDELDPATDDPQAPSDTIPSLIAPVGPPLQAVCPLLQALGGQAVHQTPIGPTHTLKNKAKVAAHHAPGQAQGAAFQLLGVTRAQVTSEMRASPEDRSSPIPPAGIVMRVF